LPSDELDLDRTIIADECVVAPVSISLYVRMTFDRTQIVFERRVEPPVCIGRLQVIGNIRQLILDCIERFTDQLESQARVTRWRRQLQTTNEFRDPHALWQVAFSHGDRLGILFSIPYNDYSVKGM
jgi:hypothetical protein